MFKPTLSVCTILFSFAFIPSIASAGLFDDDEARKAILDLRAKVDNVSAQLESRINAANNATNAKLENKAENGSVLELASQIEQLRGEIAKLHGQIEVLANDLSNAQRRQQDLYIDLDSRLRKLEPQKITVDGKEATVENGEKRAFEAALSLFKAENYKDAGAAFGAFIVNYPASAFAGAAQYWLGNSYYAQRDCKSTVTAFQQLVKAYPDYPKAPDGLLNVAACQLELKDKSASRRTLEKLMAQYPGTEEAKIAKSRLSSLKQ